MTKLRAKPFVKWVGGKRQLLKQFYELGLYPSGFNGTTGTYYEPFVGGGAVFFELTPRHAVISDANMELMYTYEVIRDNVNELIDSLKKHQNTKEYFMYMRGQDVSSLDKLDIASRFIYLNRTCFNGMYRVNRKGQFNVPYGKYKDPTICDESNLRAVSDILKNVKIINDDYRYVVRNSQPGDFIYFDPPYYPLNATSSFTSYTKDSFLDNEQIELRDTFSRLSNLGCYVMLSNSNTEFIKNIYSGLAGVKIHEVSAARAINSKGNRRGRIKELVITNY